MPLAKQVILFVGGQDFDHDAGLAEDLTIPWIISGLGIRCSHQITSVVNIIDTAPTIAHLLGLPTPDEWSGWVVSEVLVS
jgi:arylsulfatase A-like enzyme